MHFYNIVKFFQLVMENNPNMVDALFVPARCVLHCTALGNMVRDKRKSFLHKGAFQKFKGYAYSQLHKMSNHKKEVESIRSFEREKGIDHKTTFEEVEAEMEKRGFVR